VRVTIGRCNIKIGKCYLSIGPPCGIDSCYYVFFDDGLFADVYKIEGTTETLIKDWSIGLQFGIWNSRLDDAVFYGAYVLPLGAPVQLTVYKTLGATTTSFVATLPAAVVGNNQVSVTEDNSGNIVLSGGYNDATNFGTWLQRYTSAGVFIDELLHTETTSAGYESNVSVDLSGYLYHLRQTYDDSTLGLLLTKYSTTMVAQWSLEIDDAFYGTQMDTDEDGITYNFFTDGLTYAEIRRANTAGVALTALAIPTASFSDYVNYFAAGIAVGKLPDGTVAVYMIVNSFGIEADYISIINGVTGAFIENTKTFGFGGIESPHIGACKQQL